MSSATKIISFYLPQFHPIDQNDEWWGKGFTEWTNVTAARPRFDGHHQPQLPADLGFYDLRLPAAREAQAKLAKKYGIHGFCYYHYWFGGERLLEQPFDEVLSSGAPDLPFCLCWANESWTRAWDGLDRQVLKRQVYSESDHVAHIDWLIRAFRDPRYIRIDGKPLMVVYRLQNIPDAANVAAMWRRRVEEAGFPGLHLAAVRSGFVEGDDGDLLALGADSIIDFQPNRNDFPSAGVSTTGLYRLAKTLLPDAIYQNLKLSVTANNLISYKDLVAQAISRTWPEKYLKFPCVFPTWDNSARRKSAVIIQNDEPAIYQRWLESAIERLQNRKPDERIVFVNAWNEWAEGCHLEPDQRHGTAFLEATAAAVRGTHSS